ELLGLRVTGQDARDRLLGDTADMASAHRYAPPRGAISNTSITLPAWSTIYDTRQSPNRRRNAFSIPFSGLMLLSRTEGLWAMRFMVSITSSRFASGIR